MAGLKRKIFLLLVLVGLCAVIVVHQSTKHTTVPRTSPAVEKNLRFMEDKGTVDNDQSVSAVATEQKEVGLRDNTKTVPPNIDDVSNSNTEKQLSAENTLQQNNATSLIVDSSKERTVINVSSVGSFVDEKSNFETKEPVINQEKQEVVEDNVVVEDSPDLCPEKNTLLGT